MMKLAIKICIVVIILLAASYIFVYLPKTRGEELARAGLPRGFSKIESELDYLDLETDSDHIQWLTSPLRTLLLKAPNYKAIASLPVDLTELELSQTGLTSLTGLEQLSKLKKLCLRGNQKLTDLNSLAQVPIEELVLEGNGSNMVIPWKRLTQLKAIRLNGESFPLGDLEQAPALERIEITNSSGHLPEFSKMTRLSALSLGQLDIVDLPQLPSALTALELSDCRKLARLKKLPTGLLHLKFVRCGRISIEQLSVLDNLTSAHLQWGKLLKLETLAKQMPLLERLSLEDLQDPVLDELPKLWPKLTQLSLINLNGLASLAFLKAMALDSLEVKSCLDLNPEEFSVISSLAALSVLKIEMCKVEQLDLRSLRLLELELRDNQVLTKVLTDNPEPLKKLTLALCPMWPTPSFQQWPGAETFHYMGTNLWDPSLDAKKTLELTFEGCLETPPTLADLVSLNLGNTGIAHMDIIGKLPKLKVLDLQGLRLDKLPVSWPKDLREMDLRGAESIPWGQLPRNLTSLRMVIQRTSM